jgi:hypothetical protein
MEASQRAVKQPDGREISAKDMMAVYFKRIEILSNNTALDSRHRFMLLDLIEMRRNQWTQRRKSEGPKKIEEIHRDAAMERSRSQTMERQASRGGRDQLRGPPRPPFDNRVDAPIRPMARVGSEDSFGSLRPGGRPAPPARYVFWDCGYIYCIFRKACVRGCTVLLSVAAFGCFATVKSMHMARGILLNLHILP